MLSIDRAGYVWVDLLKSAPIGLGILGARCADTVSQPTPSITKLSEPASSAGRSLEDPNCSWEERFRVEVETPANALVLSDGGSQDRRSISLDLGASDSASAS